MRTRTLLLPLLLSMAVPPGVIAQTPADLVLAVQVRDRAIAEADVRTWERLTAPEFTAVDATGHLLNRAELLAQLAAADQPIRWVLDGTPLVFVDGTRLAPGNPGESAVCTDPHIALHGNGDVATRRCLTGSWSKLEVWTRTDSGWKAIAAQYAPVA